MLELPFDVSAHLLQPTFPDFLKIGNELEWCACAAGRHQRVCVVPLAAYSGVWPGEEKTGVPWMSLKLTHRGGVGGCGGVWREWLHSSFPSV